MTNSPVAAQRFLDRDGRVFWTCQDCDASAAASYVPADCDECGSHDLAYEADPEVQS